MNNNDKAFVPYDQIIKALTSYESAADTEAQRRGFGSLEEARKIRLWLNAILIRLDEVRETVEDENGSPHVIIAPDDRDLSLLQSFLTEKAEEEDKLVPSIVDGLEAKFDDHDALRWMWSVGTWLRGLLPHDFPSASPEPEPLPNTIRIALLADWGTGMYGAPISAKAIEDDREGYGLLMHLGDVYYSGTEKEEKKGFLDVWPRINGSINRACNSNHEMYSGGHAYFELLLKDERFKQQASYFALQNDHWILVGLDTAYAEWDYHGYQVDWLENIIKKKGTRRVILFSHHQLFSPFSDTSDRYMRQRMVFKREGL